MIQKFNKLFSNSVFSELYSKAFEYVHVVRGFSKIEESEEDSEEDSKKKVDMFVEYAKYYDNLVEERAKHKRDPITDGSGGVFLREYYRDSDIRYTQVEAFHTRASVEWARPTQFPEDMLTVGRANMMFWRAALAKKSAAAAVGAVYPVLGPSPYPLALSIALFFSGGHVICSLRSLMRVPLHWFWPTVVVAILIGWLWEVYREEGGGFHTLELQENFRVSIYLFILSELMLFISFFWGFFHVSLNPSIWIGNAFAPEGIVAFDWWRIPLLNTVILLSSGISLTVAHKLAPERDRFVRGVSHAAWFLGSLRSFSGWGVYRGFENRVSKVVWRRRLKVSRDVVVRPPVRYPNDMSFGDLGWRIASLFSKWGRRRWRARPTKRLVRFRRYMVVHRHFDRRRYGDEPSLWIFDTVLRGFTFLGFQAYEYITSLFTVSDSVYGSVFFALTGLHGLHVFIGATMLFVSAVLMWWQREEVWDDWTLRRSFQMEWWRHRVAFDGVAWYWHFVDVVWLFVFLIVYWWGWTPAV